MLYIVLINNYSKNRMNSTVSSKPTEAKQLARLGIEHIKPPKQTQQPLPLLLSPSFFYSMVRIEDLTLTQVTLSTREKWVGSLAFWLT